MVEYKWEDEDLKVPGACTWDDFIQQVEMVLFHYDDMEDAYHSMEEGNPNFAFDFNDYTLMVYDSMQAIWDPITNFFDFGLTLADQKYFAALDSH